MANPFFNATYYNQQNKDVYVSGMDAYTHYVQFGASEALEGAATRKPAPWFDIEFYYENNPDLIAAKLTPAQLFDHFANYGYKEGRAPNAIAQENVNADSLLTYALANADLREAFGIDADATELTAAQYVDLAGHYYQFGYNEARPGLPSTEGGGEVVGDYYLTVGKDDIPVEGDNNTVYAPIEQNFLGAVTNTLESGDIIRGEDGSVGNTLVADLAFSVSGTTPVYAPAISATTNNIDKVELRAQTGLTDLAFAEQGNFSHIDAENFHGVKEWFSNNSRATIQIEDVRTKPEDTTIGLSNSDPDVGFRVYFDPQQLTNTIRVQDSALTIKLLDITNPASLADVPVDGVSFKLDGQSYTVQSDEMGAATTHEEFVAALEAALAENEALAGLKVTLNADNTITLVDSNGAAFEKGGWKFINDEVPADGNIAYEQNVGEPDLREELITTNVVLDNVGRTSQGGIVDIGSLGAGGVQQFDVKVGDSSWVTALESISYLGEGELPNDNPDRFLEVVNVKHAEGAKGNLTIGNAVQSTDNRVEDGLTDVRELNAADFSGDLKAGVTLTADAITRYLDDAEEPVEFNYTTGSGSDNLTLDIDDVLAGDPDFALNVDLGAGDDRLNLELNTGRADKVSVNGGEGYNTIEVNSSHGTNANNTFAGFENFQKYVVAGINPTEHNFANLAGVEQVVVATKAPATNTKLVNLEDETAVSISGKNQTLANSQANQVFGTVQAQNAAGTGLTVSLDNTARLLTKDAAGNVIGGKLTVASLNVDDQVGANLTNTTVRTLDLASNGKRDVINEVTAINARFVNTFNLTGTQDLTANITAAANSTAANPSARGNLVVDASELAANVNLTVNAGIVSAVDAAADRTNTLTGAEGAGDSLTFNATALAPALKTTQATTIKGFETINFNLVGNGDFDARNVSDVEQYNLNTGVNFTLDKLTDGVNVDVKTAATGVTGNVLLTGEGEAINLSLTNGAAVGANWSNPATKLSVTGYKTINLDLNNTSVTALNPNGTTQAYNFDLELDPSTAAVARELVLTGGRDVAKNIAGSDSLTLNSLDNSLRVVDFSDYAGHVTGSMEESTTTAGVSNVKVVVGAWNLTWDVREGAQTLANTTYNTTFEFTSSSDDLGAGAAKSVWTITDFITRAAGDVKNHSVLDVSGLGITAYTDLKVETVGGVTTITDKEQSLAGTEAWEIKLTGVNMVDLGVDVNFIFAN